MPDQDRTVRGVDITETLLPGVGLRFDLTTREGVPLGIVCKRTGTFDVVVYSRQDPDEPRGIVHLNQMEAEAIADILGAPRIAERFADITREIPGLTAGRLTVPAGSRYAGHPLGEARIRTSTGASVVAIVRGEDFIPSPRPDDLLLADDELVVVGTAEGIAAVEQILRG